MRWGRVLYRGRVLYWGRLGRRKGTRECDISIKNIFLNVQEPHRIKKPIMHNRPRKHNICQGQEAQKLTGSLSTLNKIIDAA